jgi:hypothetical protein
MIIACAILFDDVPTAREKKLMKKLSGFISELLLNNTEAI